MDFVFFDMCLFVFDISSIVQRPAPSESPSEGNPRSERALVSQHKSANHYSMRGCWSLKDAVLQLKENLFMHSLIILLHCLIPPVLKQPG